MFLVYESLYGELLWDNDSTNIIGLYDSREKAVKKRNDLIKDNIENYGYVLDSYTEDIEKDKCITLYQSFQDNFNCHFSIIIQEIGVE